MSWSIELPTIEAQGHAKCVLNPAHPRAPGLNDSLPSLMMLLLLNQLPPTFRVDVSAVSGMWGPDKVLR